MQRLTLAIAIIVIAPLLGFADSDAVPVSIETEVADTVVSETVTIEVSAPLIAKDQETRCNPKAKHDRSLDRLWLISTRSLPSDACQAALTNPVFHVSQIDRCGRVTRSSLEDFLNNRPEGQPALIQVHGNRMSPDEALERGMFIYQNTIKYCDDRPLDFVIFSWPSEREGLLLKDGREKAERTDAEGLYLAWIVRELVQRKVPVAMIGFSFGGRVSTGSLHALAGGKLGGRSLPGDHLTGADVTVGLIAPALEDDWLRDGHYHGQASKNMRQLSVLYNKRDIVLKRYWLLDSVRDSMALGYTGPKGVGPRVDGSPLPVFSRDCSPTLGIRHDEKKYYLQDCRAGKQMAKLLQTTY